jgi:ergothioneine biosynthesis protein EgtB
MPPSAPDWHEFEGGLVEHGYEHTHKSVHKNKDNEGEYGGPKFCFDNELPRHPVYLQPFALANRLVSNAEYQLFIDAGGYRRPELWLADGWALVEQERWTAPLYWVEQGDESLEYTLHGLQPRRAAAPVCHVSGYEADAYARWAGARLPTEFEWERAASLQSGNSLSGPAQHGPLTLHPQPAQGAAMQQLYGACWQWTQSAYSPYPGFAPSAGAIGEYNGKFMSNQWVLRGGSCVTAASQSRTTYRNFFYPQDRWQFSGIRLAR